jgi:MFS family permease
MNMSKSVSTSNISPAEMKRAWCFVTWAGFLGSTYYLLCVVGAPRIKFLTELEATAFDFGLISSFAAVVLVFQIAGSLLCNRLRRRKVVWMVLAIIHRLCFTGVMLAPILFGDASQRMLWILFVLFCHDSIAQLSVPIWFSWMADLVPKEATNRHWAARQRTITAATIIVMIVIAVGFHYFERTDQVVLGFILFAGVGVVLGVADILLFWWVPEPEPELMENTGWLEIVVQPWRDREFRPFLLFMGYWHFAAFVAAPFFGLYMLDRMELSVMAVQLLGTGAALGVVISSQFWGLVCDCYGYRPTLLFLAMAKVFTPASFFLLPLNSPYTLPLLTIVLFVDGVLNSGLMLAIQGPLLKSTPRRNRTMYIAAANFLAIGVMACLAPALSGHVIEWVDDQSAWRLWGLNGFQVAFLASMVLRLGAIPLAARIHEPTAAPLRTFLRQAFTRSALFVPHCVHVLQDSEDTFARQRAAELMGCLRSPMATGSLIDALQDEHVEVRNAAADALGKLGNAQATEALSQALFDPARGIQSPAARALGVIGGTDSLRALLNNLGHDDPVVLAETIESLERIGDEAALLPLVYLYHEAESDAIRHRIAKSLATLQRIESVDEVSELLHARRAISQPLLR